MNKGETFYVTSPIFYPNAVPHLGHAYTTLLCDVLARYHRLAGVETYFLTGTDEHTEKVIKAAAAAQKDPHVYLEEVVASFKALYAAMDISYDQFIRTSNQAVHWPGAIEMWKRLEDAGDIYKSKYKGLYCIGHEAFLTDKDLVEGKCPDHGTVPEALEEENYFFRLSAYTQPIKQKIVSGELSIVPETRKRELLSLLEEGLQDVSFSRPKEKMSWGIPVPKDPTQTMYIWMDALTNYITGLGFGRGDERMYFWPGVHVIGKDILRFHAAFWPAMLISAKLPLPKKLFVHGMILSGGRKMSKTLGNVIDPKDLLAEYGTDAVRYYLARHISPFDDGDITSQSFKDAYNADLANGLGNLASRVMQLAQTHLQEPVKLQAAPYPKDFTDAMERFEVNKAAEYVWQQIALLDQRITAEAPFKVVKQDAERGRALIVAMVQELARIDLMLEPLMPQTSKKIIDAIVANKKPENLFPRKD